MCPSLPVPATVDYLKRAYNLRSGAAGGAGAPKVRSKNMRDLGVQPRWGVRVGKALHEKKKLNFFLVQHFSKFPFFSIFQIYIKDLESAE